MSIDSQGRPAHLMSRVSQAYRTMPANGSTPAAMDARAERALHRADAVSEAVITRQDRRNGPSRPYAEVIEVEFETVPPLPPAPEPAAMEARKARETTQPSVVDIEAIAAALAEEIDRKAAAMKPAMPTDPQPEVPVAAASVPEIRHDLGDAPMEAPPAYPPGAITGAVPDEAARITPPQAILSKIRSSHVSLTKIPVAAAFPSGGRLSQAKMLAGKLTGHVIRFTRGTVVPALGLAGLWLARNLRRKEIRRRYGATLAMVHGRWIDRQLERHFYIPTLAQQRFAPAPNRGILYEGPVPSLSFDWAMSHIPGDLREFAFVDFRAGRGRAMLLAAQRNFERIVGYEHDVPRYDDLRMNIAQFPRSRMLCRDVQAFQADRGGMSIPDQPCVLYFSNAWREELLSGIMDDVRESYRRKPRRIYLVLENTDDAVELTSDDVFSRLDLPLATKLKLRLFSPMDFQIYRSAA